MDGLSIRLFGYPEVFLKGQKLAFPTRKTLALLIFLAVEQKAHSRDKLAAIFWPEAAQDQARAAVRSTLARLRATLRENEPGNPIFLLAEREAIALDFKNCSIEGDWLALEQELENGNATSPENIQDSPHHLYQAEFLEGFNLKDVPAFEEWASLQRERLHQRAVILFEKLTRAFFDRGQFENALEIAQRWVGLDALSEPANHLVISLLLANQNRPAAIRAFVAFSNNLKLEMGLEPPASLRLLLEKEVEVPAKAVSSKNPLSGTLETERQIYRMVGRQEEFSRLTELYQNTGSQKLKITVVVGEAGIGKTRLIREFLSWAKGQGAEILQGRAFESGGRIPYQPLLSALRPCLEAENAPDDLLSDIWLVELGRLLPELLERYPDLPPAQAGSEAESKTRLFEAVTRLFEALCQRGSLLFYLDDLQWADAATLDLVQYVIRRWSANNLPFMLLFTIRLEAIQGREEIADWLANLERAIPLLRLDLRPLTSKAVAELLRDLPGSGKQVSPDLAQWLYSETGGQPFYLLETLKLMGEQHLLNLFTNQGDPAISWQQNQAKLRSMIPDSVRETIRERYRRLSPVAFNLLAAGAVLGRVFSFEQLCRVAELNENEGLSGLDELLRHNLFREGLPEESSLGGYFFSHDKIRDVIYTESGDARRRVFHRRAFEFLKNERQVPPPVLAHHALSAGLYEHAIHYNLAAGEESLRLFAVRDAVVFFEQVRKLTSDNPTNRLSSHDQQKCFLQLGRAYELLGEFSRAREIYQELLVTARQTGNRDETCVALYTLANVYMLDGLKIEPAEELLREAEQLALEIGNRAVLAEIIWNRAQCDRFSIRFREGLAKGRQALALAGEIADEELTARCMSTLAYLEVALGMNEKALEHSREAARYYNKVNNPALETDNLTLLAETMLKSGNFEEGSALCRDVLRLNSSIENVWGTRVVLNTFSMALILRGDYPEALKLCEKGLALNRENFMPMHQIFTLTIQGYILREILLLPEALATHREAREINAAIAGPFDFMLNEALGYDFARDAAWQKALPHILSGYSPDVHATFLWVGINFSLAVRTLLQNGQLEKAEQELAVYEEITRASPIYRVQYYWGKGIVAEAAGKLAVALDWLEKALELARSLQLVGVEWQISLELARLYQHAGKLEEATTTYNRAINILERLVAALPASYQKGLKTRLSSLKDA